MIELLSTKVIQLVEQIICSKKNTRKDKDQNSNIYYHSFYRNSKFSVKSLCSFLKIMSMTHIDSKMAQTLDHIIQHIQVIIDYQLDDSRYYRSVQTKYETNIDLAINYIIQPTIYPFLKEICPYNSSWYIALIDFCLTVVKSRMEEVQMDIETAHTTFYSVHLSCSCYYCRQICAFLQDSKRYEFKCDQYRTQSHVHSSIKKLNLPVSLSNDKFTKDIKWYEIQKRYTELLANLQVLRYHL